MADAGRIKHHLKHNLWREDSTILFVGYQAEGTLGRRIIEGADEVTIHGEKISVKAQIARIDGLSAHADQEELMNWLSCLGSRAENIILVHGEPDSQRIFSELVQKKFNKKPWIPQLGETLEFKHQSVQHILPDHVWLKPEIPTPVLPGEFSPPQPTLHKNSERQISQAQINSAYVRLRNKLEEFIDHGKKIGHLNQVLNILENINRWLDDQQLPKKH